MTKLEEFMDKNSMRIIDLFNKLDSDKSGEITLDELRQVCVSSPIVSVCDGTL